MCSFKNDMFERIAGEASQLARCNGKLTILSRDIQTSVRLLLPLKMATRAISEGNKALMTSKLYQKKIKIFLLFLIIF